MRKRLLILGLGTALAGAALLVSHGGDAMRDRPPPLDGPQRLFISGHSLTALLAEPMRALADGREIAITAQSLDGSSIRARREAGERFRPPPGTSVLLVTEQHRLLDAMAREDTVGELGALAERFRTENPAGTTVFYTPWADLSDPAAPGAWIAYERRAAPVWACLAERAGEGRIRIVPASLALADLVDALLRDPAALPGFEGANPRAITQALFTDRVHTTPLGSLFLARVTHSVLFGAQGEIPSPPGVDPARARALETFAVRFAQDWRQAGAPADPCADASPIGFIPAYTGYMQAAYGEAEAGALKSGIARLRHAFDLFRRLIV